MFKIMFAFQGRIGRRNYTLGLIAQNLILMLLSYLMIASLGGAAYVLVPIGEDGDVTDPEAMNALVKGIGITGILMFLLLLVFAVYTAIALQMKRLHDMNLSGWYLLVLLAPLPATLFWFLFGSVALLLFLVPFGLGLICLFGPGTRGPNQYGEFPLSIFDIADADTGDWHDRVENYRNSLKDQHFEKAEALEAEAKPRSRRQSAHPAGGFGKRGAT